MKGLKMILAALKKLGCMVEVILTLAAGAVAALTYTLVKWVFKTWNHLSMDELMYQLNAPMEGTNQEMIREAVEYCLPLIIIVFLLVLCICLGMRKKRWYHQTLSGIFLLSAAVIGLTGYYAWNRLDVSAYSENQSTYSEFIDDNYVNPGDVNITFPEKKRNLLYIFLESMEVTYSDKESGGAFDTDYIKELTEIAKENEDFSGSSDMLNGGYSMPSTTWTVAGMFAHTSGLPLTIPIEKNSMNTQESFFPDVIALGDILEKEGYSQTLLIGSQAVFGGRQLMFQDHGNFTFHDHTYAREVGLIPEDYWVWWGYEDKRLFEFAKQELTELASKDEPFNLTMLTVDTHFEDGYVCEDCEDIYGDNQYANVMACSSKKVAEFVRWIQQQDFYENTTIVIAGDHPTMDSDFCENIDEDYVRKVYTVYINADTEVENAGMRRDFTTFDLFPTTVASLGAKIEGNKLGLGTNLFSGEFTLTEKYGIEKMERELQKKSKLMEDFASGIVVPEQEKEEEVLQPGALTQVLGYDNTAGILQIQVKDFQNIPNEIQAINIAVWVEADQSDLQWMQASLADDGSYIVDIDVSRFYYRTGDYQIAVFLVDAEGSQYQIGYVIGHVE